MVMMMDLTLEVSKAEGERSYDYKTLPVNDN